MMKIDRYLWAQLLWGTALALAAILAILVLVDFMNELDKVDASYTLISVIRYIALTTAGRVYEILPIAVLIGSLMSLGNLASQSELTALRAVGYSSGRIVLSVIGAGCLFAFAVVLIGELLVPRAELAAAKIRGEDTRAGVFNATGIGLWWREGNYFIHAARADNSDVYHDVSIYELGDGHYLRRVITANSLKIKPERLLLEKVRATSFNEGNLDVEHFSRLEIDRLMSFSEKTFVAVSAEAMSGAALMKHIRFLKHSSLRYDFYELALWSKVSQPLSVLVLLLLALPYAFSPVRSSVSQRLFHGILIGLFYALLNKNAGNAAIAFGFPYFWGAFAPLLLGSAFGLYRLKLLRKNS